MPGSTQVNARRSRPVERTRRGNPSRRPSPVAPKGLVRMYCLLSKRTPLTPENCVALGSFLRDDEELQDAIPWLDPGRYVAHVVFANPKNLGSVLPVLTDEKHPITVVEDPDTAPTPDLSSYSTFVVGFSGGKDSLACVLHLLDLGVPREKIELWHHDVDGGGESFIDWPVSEDYCRKVAAALGIKFFLSYKDGGFRREMLRDKMPTARMVFETPDGVQTSGGETKGGKPKGSTRLKFPQVSSDLTVRWCSAYLKVDVGAAALRSQPRFNRARTLMITGERADESTNRAVYRSLEPDRADLRKGKKARHIDRWRPVLHWSEQDVWEIIRRYRINPHPAYKMGWGRVSCAGCIFGSADQFASLRAVNPVQFQGLVDMEAGLGVTVKRSMSLLQLVESGNKGRQPGRVYEHILTPEGQRLARLATSREYTDPVLVDDWTLPAGAFGESTGPT